MNISPFLDKKLARRFKGYDFDGNGYAEKTDFEQAVARMCEAFGHGPDSAARQRLYDLTMQLWQCLVTTADANGDGRISEAEYKNAFANSMLVTPENFEQGYRPFCEAVMDIVDVDGDGRQSVEEYELWMHTLIDVPKADTRVAFRLVDKDGNGYITTDEMVEAIREYYFNEDPQSIGSLLLGPLDS
jgi:Ca2+-binding EF-hand superfamily protein